MLCYAMPCYGVGPCQASQHRHNKDCSACLQVHSTLVGWDRSPGAQMGLGMFCACCLLVARPLQGAQIPSLVIPTPGMPVVRGSQGWSWAQSH